MMSIGEVILGGVVISIISGAIGKALGNHGKVSDVTCEDHRRNCSTLLCTKIDNLTSRVEDLKKAVNGKLLGL